MFCIKFRHFIFQIVGFLNVCFRDTDPSDQLIWIANETWKYMIDRIFSSENSLPDEEKVVLSNLAALHIILHMSSQTQQRFYSNTQDFGNTSKQTYSFTVHATDKVLRWGFSFIAGESILFSSLSRCMLCI